MRPRHEILSGDEDLCTPKKGLQRIKWKNSACFRRRIFQLSRNFRWIVMICSQRDGDTFSIAICRLRNFSGSRGSQKSDSYRKWSTNLPPKRIPLVVSALTKSGARHSVKCIPAAAACKKVCGVKGEVFSTASTCSRDTKKQLSRLHVHHR